jgi:hypothetical protein
MKVRMTSIFGAGLLLAIALPLCAQGAADSLLDRLVGEWRMTGQVRGKPAAYRLTATPVLDKRFIELHMVDTAHPPTYEARVFIGRDTIPGRVLVHWLDNTGAAFSVPAAAGTVRGDTLQFEFAYSDGPFRDTFVYRGPALGWRFRLESGDRHGGWQRFAEYDVTPARPAEK